jgi:DNA polymerase-3 subunit beta
VSLTDQVQVKIETDGKIAVNAKSLFDIVRELGEGPITLDTKANNRLQIKQNKSVFNIVGISPEEYPVFPTFKTNDFIVVNPDVLLDMIDRTIYSVSNDETRYHLNGVYF